MAYIVNEIALEMLGYSFFDANGNAENMHFDDVSSRLSQTVQPKSNSSGDNLEKLLTTLPPPKTKQNRNEHQQINTILPSKMFKKSAVAAVPVGVDVDVAVDHTGDFLKEPKVTSDANVEEKKPNEPILLSVVKHESRKIEYELRKNKNTYLRSIREQNSKSPYKMELNAHYIMKAFVLSEMQKLKDEAKKMVEFRKSVESTMSEMNSENYEKYLETFSFIKQ